jgi:hypothetical protein
MFEIGGRFPEMEGGFFVSGNWAMCGSHGIENRYALSKKVVQGLYKIAI